MKKLNILQVFILVFCVAITATSCSTKDSLSDENSINILNAQNKLTQNLEFEDVFKNSESARGGLTLEEYLNLVSEQLNDLDSEKVLTKSELKTVTGDLYIEGTFEYFDNIEYIVGVVENSVIDSSLTEEENLDSVRVFVEGTEYVNNRFNSSSIPLAGGGVCKLEERICHTSVVATAILAHIGCMATADISVVATYGLTTPVAILCHGSVITLEAAGHYNCNKAYQECINN